MGALSQGKLVRRFAHGRSLARQACKALHPWALSRKAGLYGAPPMGALSQGRLVRRSAHGRSLTRLWYMFFIELKSEREFGYRKRLNAKSQIGGQHKISEGGTKSQRGKVVRGKVVRWSCDDMHQTDSDEHTNTLKHRF